MGLKKMISLLLPIFLLYSCKNEQVLKTVTVQEFSEFVKATDYVTDAEKFGWSIVQETVYDFKTVPHATWKKPDGLHSAKPYNPVTQVSYNDAIAYCKWIKKRLPTYAEYWKIATQDKRRINVFYDSILPPETVNVIGNVWEITEPKNHKEIRLAGGSYLCNKNTCDGTSRERELMVDAMTGNVHVSFAVVLDKD